MNHTRALLLTLLLSAATSANALQVFFTNAGDPSCGGSNGFIEAGVSGGTPPYTFLWSNGATTQNIYGVPQGQYELTVTDAVFDQASTLTTLVDQSNLFCPQNAQDGHANCPGFCSGQVQIIESGINGVPPYSYMPALIGYDPQGDPFFGFPGTCGGTQVTIQVTDAMGCTGLSVQTVAEPMGPNGAFMEMGSVLGTCTGGSNGSAVITNIWDGNFPFTGPGIGVYDEQDLYVTGIYPAGNTWVATGLASGHYYVVRDYNAVQQYFAAPCFWVDSIGFDIPDLGLACGTVSGNVYLDNDQDCVQDAGDLGLPYTVLELQPGPEYAVTNGAGHFVRDLADGSYDLFQLDPSLVQLCPAGVPIAFTIAGNSVVVDVADSSTVPLDLSLSYARNAVRPGFTSTCWFTARNLSPQPSGAVGVEFIIDPLLQYISAMPTPQSIAGNTLTWTFASFTAYQQQQFSVNIMAPIGTPLGTAFTNTLNLSNSLTDADLSNNTIVDDGVVTGSFDPNDKTVRTSTQQSDAFYYITQDEYLDYTIRFQNTGTDTAFNVAITDTLDLDLDMSTFEQGVASHSFNVQFLPERVVKWTFSNILLPDSNTNEAMSHGLVSFRIKPAQPLLAGTVLSNNADIFFDFNPAVRTNDVVVVATQGTAVGAEVPSGLMVYPNPAMDELTIMSSGLPVRALMVIAADGRVLRELAGRSEHVVVDVASLAPGLYTVRIELNNGLRSNTTFIKR